MGCMHSLQLLHIPYTEEVNRPTEAETEPVTEAHDVEVRLITLTGTLPDTCLFYDALEGQDTVYRFVEEFEQEEEEQAFQLLFEANVIWNKPMLVEILNVYKDEKRDGIWIHNVRLIREQDRKLFEECRNQLIIAF